MYKVNVADKALTKLETTNFKSQHILERYDLQEWVEKTPDIFGEELLIISKELNLPSGCRLDLLAIDKNACLVVIELKRDESGKEVDWQAIKYTSYCSNFLVDEIIAHYANYLSCDEEEARASIDQFIDEDIDILNHTQRIILVSQDYHSDVISAVLWLRDYGVDIECLRLKAFIDDNGALFVLPEKIIPLPEAKDYILRKERKQKEIKEAKGSYDKGEVVEDVEIETVNGKFKIERYTSQTICVYDLSTKTELKALPLLKEFINVLALNVDLMNSNGNAKNTRSLGKDVIQAIKEQNKQIKFD